MTFDANSPEAKEAIQAAIDEAVTGLKAKNNELINQVRTMRSGQAIDPKHVEELEAQLEAAQTKLAESEKASKKLAKDFDHATKTLQAETGFTQKLLVENGLLEALAKNGVTNPVHQKAAVAMLRANAQVVVDGESRVAKIGDKDLTTVIAEWASGEEGKHFVTAAHNSGGDANGGGKGGEGKSWTRSMFDTKSQAERASFAKEGGKVID